MFVNFHLVTETWSESHILHCQQVAEDNFPLFLFSVQVHFCAYVLLPPSESVQLHPSWRKGINILRGSRCQFDLSCSCAQNTNNHQVWVSAGITIAFLLHTYGMCNPAWFYPSTLKIYLFIYFGPSFWNRTWGLGSLIKTVWTKLTTNWYHHYVIICHAVCQLLPIKSISKSQFMTMYSAQLWSDFNISLFWYAVSAMQSWIKNRDPLVGVEVSELFPLVI